MPVCDLHALYPGAVLSSVSWGLVSPDCIESRLHVPSSLQLDSHSLHHLLSPAAAASGLPLPLLCSPHTLPECPTAPSPAKPSEPPFPTQCNDTLNEPRTTHRQSAYRRHSPMPTCPAFVLSTAYQRKSTNPISPKQQRSQGLGQRRTCIMLSEPRADPLGVFKEFVGTVLNACFLDGQSPLLPLETNSSRKRQGNGTQGGRDGDRVAGLTRKTHLVGR